MKAKEALILFGTLFLNELTEGLKAAIIMTKNLDRFAGPNPERLISAAPFPGAPDSKSELKLNNEDTQTGPVTQQCFTQKNTKFYQHKTPKMSTWSIVEHAKTLNPTCECKLVRGNLPRNKINKISGKLSSCDDDPAPCHPIGGVPKNALPVPVLHSDPNFDKVLTGELAERIVSVIIKKSSKSDKARNALGLCYFDLDQLGDQLKNQPLETEGCCAKLKGELRCFLMWLLELEPTRRRRETSWSEDVCPSCQNCSSNSSLALPSSFYGLIQPPLNTFK